ncbi:MAG: serine/threonine protein kinase [Chloroflexi bacterium]|nr:serine/threonine protein kinase [Chloroflexota bacterium]
MTKDLLLDRYRLEGRLGSGGMAEVYRGTDERLGRPVAVKILLPHLAADPTFTERLRREVEATAALTHPNVVRVYDQGRSEDRPFLVLELVEGESLAALLGRQGSLGIERAIAIACDVLAALEHAHGRGLIHRDVKPQNVLLPPGGPAKLADFGIAHVAADSTLTIPGEVIGSVHYLAPERLEGRAATPAADQYGVGVILYQMLTGRLPFEGDLPAAVAAQHLQQAPAAPSTLRPDLPGWLEQVVLKALAKDPEARFSSAAAMRRALEEGPLAVHNAPTMRVAVPPPAPQVPGARAPARRPPRRRWAYVTALAGALALVTLGLAYGLGSQRAEAPPPAQAEEQAGAGAPATSTASPPPTAVPTATPPPAATPTRSARIAAALQQLAALRALVQAAPSTGRYGQATRKLLEKLAEIEKEIRRGDFEDARKEAHELIKEAQKMAAKGELHPTLSAGQLIAQLTALAGLL